MKNKVFIAMTAAVAMAALTACGDSMCQWSFCRMLAGNLEPDWYCSYQY